MMFCAPTFTAAAMQSADEAARHVAAADECRVVMQFIAARSFPENRRSDSHPGRARRDRRFEVAPTCPSTACRASSPSAFERVRWQCDQRWKSRRCSSKVSRGGGMHMRPRSLSRGSSATTPRQRQHLVRRDAALARLVREPDLDTYIEWRRVVRPLFVEADGDALAIERVHPVEMLRNGACLVRLQLTGEVPGEVAGRERAPASAGLPAGSSRRNRAGRIQPASRMRSRGLRPC